MSLPLLLSHIDEGLADLRAAWMSAPASSRSKWMHHIDGALDDRNDITHAIKATQTPLKLVPAATLETRLETASR